MVQIEVIDNGINDGLRYISRSVHCESDTCEGRQCGAICFEERKGDGCMLQENTSWLVQLLAYELFGQQTEYRIPDQKLKAIIQLAQKHAVDVLIYYQLKNIVASKEEIKCERSRAIASILCGEELMQTQKDVLEALQKAGVFGAILKGSSVAALYPNPELRALGDIDILIHEQDMKRAEEVLIANGYIVGEHHDFHASYFGNGVVVELHQNVSRFPATKQGKYAEAKMKEALQHTHVESMYESTFSVLDPQYQMIALLAHMERHMIDSSIGLRQLCDWAVTVHHFRDQITESILQELEKCGLLRFACVLTQICVDYLGMPSVSWCGNVDSKFVNLMMKEITEAGNIQDSNIERELSGAFVDRSHGGLFALLRAYANNMTQKAQRDYAIARRLPVLLPLFWIYYPLRWKIRSIRGERKAVSFLSTLQLANKRKHLYNWLGMFQ